MKSQKKKDKLDYVAHPTIAEFHKSDKWIRCIRGPIGSGKSTGCCWELMRRALTCEPCRDGIRRTRTLVIRETYGKIETTCLKTWLTLFPVDNKRSFLRMKPPITYTFKTKSIHFEVLFMAFSTDDDVEKLLSLEITNAWVNEAREIKKKVITALLGRVGRYPAIDDNCPSHLDNKSFPDNEFVIMDTNPPSRLHWLCKKELKVLANISDELVDKDLDEDDWGFFIQPSGLAKNAENLEWLKNGRGYYERLARNNDPAWVKVNVCNEFGEDNRGRPVFEKEYRDEIHCSETEIKPIPNIDLDIGLDFGLTPAAIITQLTPLGQRICLEEIVTEHTSIQEFSNILLQVLNRKYHGFKFDCYGDPSGEYPDQQKRTAFDLLRSCGITAKKAPSNELQWRLEGVKYELNRLVNGVPALILNGKKCPILRDGFKSGYCYKKLNVSDGDCYEEKPNKRGIYSHIQDALQYVLLSTGSYDMIAKNRKHRLDLKPTTINTNFNLW